MKIKLLAFFMIGLSYSVGAQTNEKMHSTSKKTESSYSGFSDYVNKNAISILPAGKDGMQFDGEVVRVKSNLLSDYQLTALEDKAQYFKMKDENAILKVESMYRLKLMFENQNNIKTVQ